MSGLPWVRIDCNLYQHPKMLELLDRKDGHRSAWVFICSVCYSGQFGTDGYIKPSQLPAIHGRQVDAENLAAVGLWDVVPGGWLVHDYADYNPLRSTSDQVRKAKRAGGARGACHRWHQQPCELPDCQASAMG